MNEHGDSCMLTLAAAAVAGDLAVHSLFCDAFVFNQLFPPELLNMLSWLFFNFTSQLGYLSKSCTKFINWFNINRYSVVHTSASTLQYGTSFSHFVRDLMHYIFLKMIRRLSLCAASTFCCSQRGRQRSAICCLILKQFNEGSRKHLCLLFQTILEIFIMVWTTSIPAYWLLHDFNYGNIQERQIYKIPNLPANVAKPITVLKELQYGFIKC